MLFINNNQIIINKTINKNKLNNIKFSKTN